MGEKVRLARALAVQEVGAKVGRNLGLHASATQSEGKND
jgi:tetrahydromethanopterin S-methyltransferase subunit G